MIAYLLTNVPTSLIWFHRHSSWRHIFREANQVDDVFAKHGLGLVRVSLSVIAFASLHVLANVSLICFFFSMPEIMSVPWSIGLEINFTRDALLLLVQENSIHDENETQILSFLLFVSFIDSNLVCQTNNISILCHLLVHASQLLTY